MERAPKRFAIFDREVERWRRPLRALDDREDLVDLEVRLLFLPDLLFRETLSRVRPPYILLFERNSHTISAELLNLGLDGIEHPVAQPVWIRGHWNPHLRRGRFEQQRGGPSGAPGPLSHQ